MATVHLGIAAILVGLGAWAGFLTSGETMVGTGLAIFIVCHLLFGLWVRSRVQPVAGDRMVMPTAILLSAAMLIGILPRLFWPGAERVHIAGSIVSLAVMAVMVVVQFRRRRALRQGGPTL